MYLHVPNLTNESRDWKIRSKAISGNHSRLTSSDTVWPNGCSESESKSGISSGCPMRKGRPEASLAVANKQWRGIHIPGPVDRVIPCRGLASSSRGTTVRTARF